MGLPDRGRSTRLAGPHANQDCLREGGLWLVFSRCLSASPDQRFFLPRWRLILERALVGRCTRGRPPRETSGSEGQDAERDSGLCGRQRKAKGKKWKKERTAIWPLAEDKRYWNCQKPQRNSKHLVRADIVQHDYDFISCLCFF